MWQALVAAAVAGSGLLARNVLSSAEDSVLQFSHHQLVDRSASPEICRETEHPSTEPQQSSRNSPDHKDEEERLGDRIFRFSSSGSKTRKSKLPGHRKKTHGNGVKKGVELERRLTVCLKRRKTGKSVSVDRDACLSNGDTNTLFGWGVGFGIMYMMSTGKSEIRKLNATMDQTVKAVGELRNALCKRKASCISMSPYHGNTNMYEGCECPSRFLTEEPEPQHAVQEMDQLEADLEYELSKLTSCGTEVSFDEGPDSDLYQSEVLENSSKQMCNSYQFGGVKPSVLDKKLSQLLIQQQESQINELEHELLSANSKLNQKEAELRALKDCVRRLSNFSFSNISGLDSRKFITVT
uniref:Uncharacterized protein n=1 Tax=Kalanchoe fedtschenkoi TaxID=63787 RepID=A0A7N0U790_KALFE